MIRFQNTNEAIEYGNQNKSEPQITDIKNLREKKLKQYQTLMDIINKMEKNEEQKTLLNLAVEVATDGQLYREALLEMEK